MSRMAEKNIIGSLMMDSSCMDKMYNRITAEMFTSPILGRIYLEFQRGYDNHYRVDGVLLEQKLRCENLPQEIIVGEIKECVESTITSAEVETYISVVESDYKAQKFGELLGSIKISPDRVSEQIAELLNDLEALQDNKKASSKTLSEITRENKDKYFCEDGAPRMKIGFAKLDDLLGGLEGGDMIVIGARPAVGKSAFVTQITSFLAKSGKRIGFYNLEMQEKQVYERFVVSESGISLTRLRRAVRFLGDEKERFDKANMLLESQENVVITTGSKSVSEIRSESRHMGYDIIIIDYMQLLRSDKNYRSDRRAEVGAISRAIKSLAMDLKIPIIALSQLNRVSEMREAREPTMAELREAGDIEQDASVIILLWNLSNEDKSKKGCKIEKQRQGETGKVVLKFNGDLMRFEETGEDVKEAQQWASAADDDCPFR